MGNEVKVMREWQASAREESGIQEASRMSAIPVLKVYNKPM